MTFNNGMNEVSQPPTPTEIKPPGYTNYSNGYYHNSDQAAVEIHNGNYGTFDWEE